MNYNNDYEDDCKYDLYGNPLDKQPIKDTSTKGCGWLIAIFIISLIISIIISL